MNNQSVQMKLALLNKLRNLEFPVITLFRCVADGCGGQNKKDILMFMLQYSLTRHSSKHSFIPPDCVFAQIEEKRFPRSDCKVWRNVF